MMGVLDCRRDHVKALTFVRISVVCAEKEVEENSFVERNGSPVRCV